MKLPILLFVVLMSSVTLNADTRRVFLGNVDLAGLVPTDLPGDGDVLRLNDTASAILNAKGDPVGYLPVLFREPCGHMLSKGLPITLEVSHVYQTPRPGKFIRVTVWADTEDLSLIRPLIYHIPIHTENDLSDYE